MPFVVLFIFQSQVFSLSLNEHRVGIAFHVSQLQTLKSAFLSHLQSRPSICSFIVLTWFWWFWFHWLDFKRINGIEFHLNLFKAQQIFETHWNSWNDTKRNTNFYSRHLLSLHLSFFLAFFLVPCHTEQYLLRAIRIFWCLAYKLTAVVAI